MLPFAPILRLVIFILLVAVKATYNISSNIATPILCKGNLISWTKSYLIDLEIRFIPEIIGLYIVRNISQKFCNKITVNRVAHANVGMVMWFKAKINMSYTTQYSILISVHMYKNGDYRKGNERKVQRKSFFIQNSPPIPKLHQSCSKLYHN